MEELLGFRVQSLGVAAVETLSPKLQVLDIIIVSEQFPGVTSVEKTLARTLVGRLNP